MTKNRFKSTNPTCVLMSEPIVGHERSKSQSCRAQQSNDLAGALSLLRRPDTRDIEDADIVVSGIGFVMTTSNPPGARFGPRAIGAGSTGWPELLGYPLGIDPFAHSGRRLRRGLPLSYG